MGSLDDTGTQVGEPPDRPQPPRRDAGRGRSAARGFGEVLITAGLVVLLFVVYEVYVTDWISAGKQRTATAALDQQWRLGGNDEQQRRWHGLAEGQGFAKMYVPTFGADYHFTVLEGTTEDTLAIGPGHYQGSAYPGENGNFAIAGHRVGKGAPFNDIDLLATCDAIVVETKFDWFVYRVLPGADEARTWATGGSRRPHCARVNPLGGAYAGLVGQEVVDPSENDVVAAVPHDAASSSATAQVALLTLTTCNPKFSDRQRLIVHAVLTDQVPKGMLAAGQVPDALEEG